MDNTDYTYKLGLNDSILSGLQRKAQIEQAAAAETKQQEKAQWLQVAKFSSKAVSNNIEYTKQKQKQDFINTLSDSLASQLTPLGASQIFQNQAPGTIGPRNQTSKTIPVASFDPQKSDMVRAAVQLNPEAFSQQYAESIFNKPKPLALQVKSVLVDGNPTEASFDPATNSWFDTNNQKITGKITPLSQQVAGELTEADRRRLMPLAKAVVEGRASPSTLVSARGAEKEKLSLLAAEIDPNFDLSLAPQRIATRKDFSSGGKSGQSLASLNTALGHLDTMVESGTKLNNSQLKLWNRVKNTAKRETGDPAVDKMLAARDAVTSELGRVFQATGVVTDSERHEFRARLSEASSPEQIRAVAETWIDLLKSRTDTLKANWEQSMGGNEPPVPFINTKTKRVLEKHGYDAKTLEKTDQISSGGDMSKMSTADLIKLLQEDK